MPVRPAVGPDGGPWREKMKNKVIITAALAGSATMKQQNEAVPYTPEEFAGEALKCQQAGAAIVHVHARDVAEGGLPTADIPKIRATVDAIRDRCPGLILNMTSAIAAGIPAEKRIAPIVALKPEMASLNTNSMNFALIDRKSGTVLAETIFENAFSMIVDFASKMKANGVKPECEIYDLGGIYNILALRRQKGLFEEPMHFQFVMGVAGGCPFDIGILHKFIETVPKDATWSICGIGPNQYATTLVGAALGGHIRVGLEDNIRNVDGSLSRGSYEQVEWAVKVAGLAGRGIATPSEAREILNLRRRD